MKASYFFIVGIISCAMISFIGCSDDDETYKPVKKNQLYYDGHTYDMTPSVSYSPGSHRYSIGLRPLYTRDWDFHLFIDSTLVGKTIDLTTPLTGNIYADLGIDYIIGSPINDYIGYMGMSMGDGTMWGHIGSIDFSEKQYNESIFKFGTLRIDTNEPEFQMNISGILKDGKEFNASLSFPTKDIKIIVPLYK